MIKIFFISLLSNIILFAEQTKPIDKFMFPWLVASILSIGLVFWGIYKSMKTQNPKYGFVILVGMLILVGLLFL